MRRRALLAGLLGAATAAGTPAGPARGEDGASAAVVAIDRFEDAAAWSAHPADGVRLAIATDEGFRGRGLRLDFAFSGGGYAVARRATSIDLPGNWAFRFRLRGEAPPNHLEFKLLDEGGENVWWCVRRDVEFPSAWTTFTIRKRHVTFAWGPLGGGEIRHAAALELVVTAGSGGAGTVWIDELELVTLPPEGAAPPRPAARASTQRRGRPAAAAVDGRATSWSPSAADAAPWIALDLGGPREFGGLVVDWAPGRSARSYAVQLSDDGTAWRTVREVRGGDGGRDRLLLPESEARHLRLAVAPGGAPSGVALRELSIRPLAWGATREAFFGAIAAESPRGSYPRGMSAQQAYWTVVGVDRDAREALLSEDGALETGRQRFSLEPFLLADGRLVTWADVRATQSLEDGCLPIPRVHWDAGALGLEVLAFGRGRPGASAVVVRYRLTNRSGIPREATLCVALRPFQVNPPSQFLNFPGGTARTGSIERAGDVAKVDGEVGVKWLTPPAAFGATTFDGGDVVADWLRRGGLPAASAVEDPFGAASAAMSFPRALPPGGSVDVVLVVPLGPEAELLEIPDARDGGAAWAERELDACRAAWRERTSRVTVELPPAASGVVESLRSQLGWILVNRAGPAIQPGTRAYARSWIRDGALTSSALLRLGHGEAARDFLEWFAPHQYDSGKIPCVVDWRGADPVPEHDSSGEFIFLVAEVYRYGRDRALAERLWPRVAAAVGWLDALRQERLGAEWSEPARIEFRGILPPSISHEGYSAKPMHSYWDDFWARKGFRDAAWLAGELGRDGERARIEGIAAAFERDLAASVDAAMRRHGIEFVPGCADLGDFDATSTTIALAPTGAAALLPRAALERTFERYREFFAARRRGAPWTAYTPYELRNVGALARLGRRDDAVESLGWFLEDQRPRGWRQWPEIVWRDARDPRFLGDLPHGWVASDCVRSVLDLLAYADDDAGTIVLGAGAPPSWLEGEGIVVRGLPTPWGLLDFTMRRDGRTVEVTVGGDVRVPPGGIVLRPPLPGALREARLGGRLLAPAAGEDVVLRAVPEVVRLRS
jgi:hypothetical protein